MGYILFIEPLEAAFNITLTPEDTIGLASLADAKAITPLGTSFGLKAKELSGTGPEERRSVRLQQILNPGDLSGKRIGLSERFHVQPLCRFGVRRQQVDPPLDRFKAQAIGLIHRQSAGCCSSPRSALGKGGRPLGLEGVERGVSFVLVRSARRVPDVAGSVRPALLALLRR